VTSVASTDDLPSAPPVRRTTFSSLRTRNYRIFVMAQLVSNTGAWVQRIAQDWLVLSITGSTTAVGVTTALQFLPTLLFGIFGGRLADRYPKHRILQFTQAGMCLLATTLAVLTLTGTVRAWHVYVVAFVGGLLIAADNPTRQAFVTELVGPAQLRNAIGLNSSAFQLGALVGPAISGVLINAVGPGWSFAANALSYVAPLVGLALLRERDLIRRPPTTRVSGGVSVLRYVRERPRMLWTMVLIGVFAVFTNNLPVTLAAYAKFVFHSGAGGYGLLSSVLAVGSLVGALVSARRSRTTLRGMVVVGAAVSGLALLAAAMPGEDAFTAVLAGLGAMTLMLVTSANATVQMASDDGIRGRVMGLYLLIFTGSGTFGGPLLGAIDQHLGARTGLLLAGAVPGLATALVAMRLGSDKRGVCPS